MLMRTLPGHARKSEKAIVGRFGQKRLETNAAWPKSLAIDR